MRVAVFIDGTFIPERDGASTRFAQLPRHLSQQGTEVTVFHCYRGWSNLDRIAMEPFPTYFFPPEVFYSDLNCLVRILQDVGVDVIQMNDAETIVRIGFRLAKALDVKVVYEAHYHTSTLATALGASSARVEALRVLERDVSELVDHLIVFTDEDRCRWVTLSGCSENRVSVVPFGVDHVISGEYPGERQGLVFIGNLFYEPNRRAIQRIATEIMPMLRMAQRDPRVVVIGDIPIDLRELCSQAGMEAIGEVPDPMPWLARSAVGLAPVSEASGVRAKILQCLASGMPVVAMPSAAEGLSLPALFVEENSPNFALRCVDILGRPRLYEPFVRSTKSALRESGLWPNVARTAAGVYERIMGQTPMRRPPRRQDESPGVPMWIEEVLRKGRFADADTLCLKAYRFGLAKGGGITTYQ
jgi:Glycosyl transferases group 1/Glycosyltransferase Family 4